MLEACIVIALFVAGYFVRQLYVAVRDKRPKVVEEYKVETIEEEGFPKIVIRIEDSHGQRYPFVFALPFAHTLSDDLLRASARTAPKKTG